jgi:hypothetical protein
MDRRSFLLSALGALITHRILTPEPEPKPTHRALIRTGLPPVQWRKVNRPTPNDPDYDDFVGFSERMLNTPLEEWQKTYVWLVSTTPNGLLVLPTRPV